MLIQYKQTNIRSTANLRGQEKSARYGAAMPESISLTARRILERMDDLMMTQAELAHLVGVSQSAISQVLNGKTANSRHLPAIAEKLSINLGWLRGSTDEKIVMLREDDTELSESEALRMQLEREAAKGTGLTDRRREFRAPSGDRSTDVLASFGLVPVKEIDLALGAGGTYIDDSAVSVTVRYFPRQWLREFTDAPPDMLAFARVRGTSMKPTLVDGAILIIDLRRKRIDEQDELWWIVVAEIGMVKRIWANPDGSYKIKSDNPNVGPETAHDEEMHAIGRVVASIGKH